MADQCVREGGQERKNDLCLVLVIKLFTNKMANIQKNMHHDACLKIIT